MFTRKLIVASSLLLMGLVIWGPVFTNGQSRTTPVETHQSSKFRIPTGIPTALWNSRIPENNRITRGKVSLGERLYFDKRLSRDGTISCASCHDPANAFTAHVPTAIGPSGKIGTRNAPTILNAMFNDMQFWDGRAQTLEDQAKQPLINPMEMGMLSHDAVVARISAIPEYQREFQQHFKSEGVTIDTIVKAIATFERTQLSGNSPFDRFIAGDKKAITDHQKKGWELFKGNAKCVDCHAYSSSSPFFTDFKFHNTGIGTNDQKFEEQAGRAREIRRDGQGVMTDPSRLAHEPQYSDLGRFLVSKQPGDIAAFKTPTLRDIELTTPYMHNGTMTTLLDIVRFYNQGGEKNPNVDEKMRPLGLTDEEMSDIVEFLRALTSDDVLRQAQSSKPQTRSAVTVGPLGAVWIGRSP